MKRPNWNEWKHTPSVTVWQACALSMDIDPHSMVPHRRLIGTSSGVGRPMEKDAVGPSLEPYDFSSPDEKKEFERRQRTLRMHLSNRTFFSPGVLNQIQQDNSLVRLSEFASWAVSVVKWEGLPVELVEMASDLPKSGVSPVSEKQTTTTDRGHVSDKLVSRMKEPQEDRLKREKETFDYWLKMPSWKPLDAVYLLTYQYDPLDSHPDLMHMMSLAMLPLADHFRLFGLIDSYSVELDGLHIDGDKHTPNEWIACYHDFPGAEPLPYDDQTPALPSKPTGTTERAHVSDKLAMLNQAAAVFWKNADREDRGTHRTNAEVAAWLVERGLSQSLADKAASIIRPEWAPTGRKPEE